ncbi:MAG: hypothetical protein H6Q73_1967 [Firmicutes bacterium]|nr:hypothetical protein [Bacillota bacterium]
MYTNIHAEDTYIISTIEPSDNKKNVAVTFYVLYKKATTINYLQIITFYS